MKSKKFTLVRRVRGAYELKFLDKSLNTFVVEVNMPWNFKKEIESLKEDDKIELKIKKRAKYEN